MKFHHQTNSVKIKTKFFNIFKKLIYGPFSYSLGQKIFSWNIWPCHAQLHMDFQHHAKIQKKLMIQFQEYAKTEGRKTEGRTDPISQDPSGYCQGSKYTLLHVLIQIMKSRTFEVDGIVQIVKNWICSERNTFS